MFKLRHISNARISALLATLLALGIWLLALAALQAPLADLEERSGDWIWRLAASKEPERRVIIVDIDETSLQKLGPWPWPRERLSQLSDQLAAGGAALQIYDIVFPTAEKGDDKLHASLQHNQAILSQIFAIQGTSPARQGQVSAPLDWPACPGIFPSASNYIANNPGFSDLPAGHITPLVADDGSVRQQPAIICHDNKPYPALFLAAAMQGTQSPRLTTAAGRSLLDPAWQITGLDIAKAIPLDPAGNIRIPWLTHPNALTAIPAHRILDGSYPSNLLTNAWVLIGSTALGINDRVATPFDPLGAGLQVHAQLLLGLLEDRLPITPRNPALFTLLIMLGGASLLALQRRQRPVAGLILASLIIVALACALKAALLLRYALWLEWLPGSLFLLILAITLSIAEHTRSRFERDRIYAHLASYLPPPVAAALANRDPSSAIDAARRNVIAVYADIRNFSAYCEISPPEETTAVLHALISTATAIVEKHGGTVQSIHGDGILAIWSDPETPAAAAPKNPPKNPVDRNPPATNADSALLAARELLAASRLLLPSPESGPHQPLALGIGLESGPATIGSFGLARRRTHLALGRAITIAVRLEQMTAELAHPILIGENLAGHLGQHQLQSQGVFLLEGIVSPCHIYAYPLKNCV